MRKFSLADNGTATGQAKDRVGLTAGTTYFAKYWNDNFFNIFNTVENAGYSLIDDDLEQMTKVMKGRYVASYTYNTSAIATQTVNDVVLGSDNVLYEVQADAIIGDDPVGSATGNWEVYNGIGISLGGGETLYPDGSIVGTNANGEYTKYANGNLTCRGSISPVSNNNAGTVITYPFAFIDTTYKLFAGTSYISSGALASSAVTEQIKTSTTQGKVKVSEHSTTTIIDIVSQEIQWTAIGRWK